MELLSRSVEQTRELGVIIARHFDPGDVLCLDGALGTGKTALVQGIAAALGCGGPVQSPTFVIIREHPGIMLCHVDAFRLENPEELIHAGIDEYLDGRWRCAVEWGGHVRGALPRDSLEVTMDFGEGDFERTIEFRGSGSWKVLLKALEGGIPADGE